MKIIDLGSFDENYANFSGISEKDEVILVDLEKKKEEYGNRPNTLLTEFIENKKNISEELKSRINKIISKKNICDLNIQKINADAIDFFGKYKPKNIDKIHCSYLFSNIDREFGDNKNVEAQKILLLNSLIALKEEGVLEIAKDVQKMLGEKDSAQMKLIKELVVLVNKNQKSDHKFIIEKEEKITIPETTFEALYIINEQPRFPGKITLKKVKKTEEEKNLKNQNLELLKNKISRIK